jgi:hypothetical protein
LEKEFESDGTLTAKEREYFKNAYGDWIDLQILFDEKAIY